MHTSTVVEKNLRKPSSLDTLKTKLRNWRGAPANQESIGPLESQVTIETYVHRVKDELWHGDHRIRSTSKILRLSAFADNKNKPLASYTEEDIRAFIKHLKAEGLGDATTNRYLAAISCVFKKASKGEKPLISHPPCVEWKTVDSKRPRFYTDEEYKELLAFFRDAERKKKTWWIAEVIIIGYNTGMRLGEILGLNNQENMRLKDVEGMRSETIRSINKHAKQDTEAMGYKELLRCKRSSVVEDVADDDPGVCWGVLSEDGELAYLFNTKNNSSRMVPLNSAAKEALAKLGNCPSKFFSHHVFYSNWRKAREEIAPGDKDFVGHVWRHSCASRLVMDLGIDGIVAGSMLGHKSPLTTRKYVHQKKDPLIAIGKMLEAYN